jgi:hypothetical protein
MKSFSVTKLPDELWTLLLETLPRSLNINDGILRVFEQQVVSHFDDEQHVRDVLRGTLGEDDPSIEEVVSHYQELVEKYDREN